MPEISQPTPIKPAWPVRRDDSRQKRSEPEPEEKKKHKPPPEPTSGGDNKHPQIDDYA